MFKEYKTMIILTLCCLTMVSIGFSSWVISDPSTTTTVDGTLEADSIIDNRKYVSKVSEDIFSYNEHGFIQNGYYSNTGNIFITYNINPQACVSYFDSLNEPCEGLYLELKAEYANGFTSTYDIFKNSSLKLEYKINDGEYLNNFEVANISNYTVVSKFKLDSSYLSSSSLNITYKYTFTIKMGSNFTNNAYDKLLSIIH